ncbi:hypothetical protein [Streptomyces johnsoniae]|uniref:Uncharacterized protein n=1 Tax=Streptomyces johnsoniae TaxID=3075532 RepID=A0ABU2SE28_9ACTN|nr:hypothetical protein [Streptomyces sp. DSM 41886]MDT0445965.1 hypothetical protein [Streptomyces sp. DSM 41886]
MTSLTHAEYRRLKKDARAFARNVRAGRTYYIAEKTTGLKAGTFVGEIQFTKKPLIGLTWGGGIGPERFYLLYGPVYDRRDHPAIRNLRTWPEQNEHEAKFEAAFLNSRERHDTATHATRGTAFRSAF